jgi:hypothetical protein
MEKSCVSYMLIGHTNRNATKQQQINLYVSYEETGVDVKKQKTIYSTAARTWQPHSNDVFV